MGATVEQRMDQSVSSVLIRRAIARLQATSLGPVRHLSVEIEGTALVFRGRLDSFNQKQIAQEIVKRIEGVESIRNQTYVV